MAKKASPPDNINPLYVKELQNARRSIGLLQFESSRDRNYIKWRDKTENLIITCFGESSNQHRQYNRLTTIFSNKDIYSINLDNETVTADKFKGQMKDQLTNFLDELSLRMASPSSQVKAGGGIRITNTVITKVEIHNSISAIIEQIESSEPDDTKVVEAKRQLKDLEAELAKDKPQWSVVKGVLMWLLNFSRDAFIQIIPLILQKYGVF